MTILGNAFVNHNEGQFTFLGATFSSILLADASENQCNLSEPLFRGKPENDSFAVAGRTWAMKDKSRFAASFQLLFVGATLAIQYSATR